MVGLTFLEMVDCLVWPLANKKVYRSGNVINEVKRDFACMAFVGIVLLLAFLVTGS